jgi:glutathione peroxidase
LKQTEGYRPRWNFYKVLLDGEGAVVDTFASTTGPMSRKITKQIETLLN